MRSGSTQSNLDQWARLVPELACSDFERSRDFYTNVLGFRIAYDRDNFAYLEREGAQIMIAQDNGYWSTGERNHPFGRGINLQIEVSDIARLRNDVADAGVNVFVDLEDAWYRAGGTEIGNRQFLVQDPDGYLLRFFQDLGSRPIVGIGNLVE